MRRLIVSVNILIERESVGNFVRSQFDEQNITNYYGLHCSTKRNIYTRYQSNIPSCHFFPSKETQVRIRLPENNLHILFIPKNCENVAESIIEIVRKKQTLRKITGHWLKFYLTEKESGIFND